MTTVDWTCQEWTWTPDERARDGRYPWPAGPWDDEPDKVVWVDPATGLDCLIHRNRMGGLCGYVGVGPEHPFHGVSYSGCVTDKDCEGGWGDDESHVHPERALGVHGGLTFSDFCQEALREERGDGYGICHVAQPGRPERVYWFGFDCGHSCDLMPGLIALESGMGFGADRFGEYRTIHYVKAEVESLAVQLEAVSSV